MGHGGGICNGRQASTGALSLAPRLRARGWALWPCRARALLTTPGRARALLTTLAHAPKPSSHTRCSFLYDGAAPPSPEEAAAASTTAARGLLESSARESSHTGWRPFCTRAGCARGESMGVRERARLGAGGRRSQQGVKRGWLLKRLENSTENM